MVVVVVVVVIVVVVVVVMVSVVLVMVEVGMWVALAANYDARTRANKRAINGKHRGYTPLGLPLDPKYGMFVH